MKFSILEQEQILEITSHALLLHYGIDNKTDFYVEDLCEALNKNFGVFISLYLKNDLRGCIGNMSSQIPLYQSVQKLVVSAANDRRFEKMELEEIKEIDLEISVLSPLKRIYALEEIELGKHGIYIKNESGSGTFLPQVINKTGWNVEEFVGRCSRDKVRIGWDGWKTAEMFTYEAFIFRKSIIVK